MVCNCFRSGRSHGGGNGILVVFISVGEGSSFVSAGLQWS